MPLFWNSYKSIIEKVCISNLFHNVQVIPMKCSPYTLLRPDIGVSELCPFFRNWNIGMIEKVCVSNFFHRFQFIQIKLATPNPHEEKMFIKYFLWGLTQRIQCYDPFWKFLYVHKERVSQSSSIVFKSSTWCVDLFLVNDFFDIQTNFFKQLFAIHNKLFSCLEMDHGSSKTA